MTEQEARKLNSGDEVVWSDGTRGRVVSFDYENCIVMRFDGDEGDAYLHPADCQLVQRAEKDAAR